jgi:hypothetical protein
MVFGWWAGLVELITIKEKGKEQTLFLLIHQ